MQVLLFEKDKTRQIQLATERRYKDNPNAVINPHIGKVKATPLKYWKKGSGKEIKAMSKAEKDNVDAKIKQ